MVSQKRSSNASATCAMRSSVPVGGGSGGGSGGGDCGGMDGGGCGGGGGGRGIKFIWLGHASGVLVCIRSMTLKNALVWPGDGYASCTRAVVGHVRTGYVASGVASQRYACSSGRGTIPE